MSANIRRVFAAIQKIPSTCDEVERATGLAHQVASARMRDLAKRNAICRTPIQRRTRLGRPAWVWRTA